MLKLNYFAPTNQLYISSIREYQGNKLKRQENASSAMEFISAGGLFYLSRIKNAMVEFWQLSFVSSD